MESVKLGLVAAIKSGDMGEVKEITSQYPDILRTPISDNKQTPLHLACKNGKGDIAAMLIGLEKARVNRGVLGTPSYNMKDGNGDTSVFVAVEWNPTQLVELHLELDDLEVKHENGMPLLWYCARWGRLSEKVVSDVKLRGQIEQRWKAGLCRLTCFLEARLCDSWGHFCSGRITQSNSRRQCNRRRSP